MWHKHGVRPPRALSPLDPAALERLALRYVERFATTRGKLAAYLARKVRERGWAGDVPPDPAAVAERMAVLGYVDDRGFAEQKGAALVRRGYGARRVADSLRAAGVAAEDAAAALEQARADSWDSALRLAQRRRIGPFAVQQVHDPKLRERQLATLLRAGHDMATARRIVSAAPGQIPSLE